MNYYNNWNNYKFIYPFNGCDTIKETFSQAYQDIFILTMLNGKSNGTYLEIGAAHPDYGNNTYLLSKYLSWKGISIDIVPEVRPYWENLRPKDNLIIGNAMNLDYSNILPQYYNSDIIDYLQVDIEPSNHTLAALKKLPLNKYRFKIITFETDLYMGGPGEHVQKESRELLTNLGYELIIGNVVAAGYGAYEDWWVDLNHVNKGVALHIKNRATKIQDPLKLLLY